PIPVCDITAGMQLAIGILAALEARDKTGNGQWVEAPLFDAGLSVQLYESAGVFATGQALERLGQRHRGVAPYQIFSTGTDHITIGVAQQNFWEKLCRLIDREDLKNDPRFENNALRVANTKELVPLLEVELAKQSAEFWLESL